MFLKNLDYLLTVNQISRNQLSKCCGIPASTINSWYSRGWENVTLKTLRKLADFFDITIDDLVSGDTVDVVCKSKRLTDADVEIMTKMTELLEAYKQKNIKTYRLPKGTAKINYYCKGKILEVEGKKHK